MNVSKNKSFYDGFVSAMVKNQGYYDQFNNCDNIRNNFDYLTVPEAAILWCGVSRSELATELAQCTPKGTGNALSKNTMKHPYIQCVEPRCVLLHQAFDDGKLKMGRDGNKGDYIWGEKDKKENDNLTYGAGHMNPDRRTIKINDLKEFIAEYHADDMPKTLFSDIDIHKSKPITHEDYSALLVKNQALEARLEKAIDVYQEQKAEIAILKEQQNNEAELVGKLADDLKDVPHQSYRTVDRVMYAMAKLTKLDNIEPYSQNNPSLNASITTLLQNDGLTLEYQAVGKWLSRINDVKPLK